MMEDLIRSVSNKKSNNQANTKEMAHERNGDLIFLPSCACICCCHIERGCTRMYDEVQSESSLFSGGLKRVEDIASYVEERTELL